MTSMANRSGEAGIHPFRNDRFFQMEDFWYYTTREGVNIGPFDSCYDAQLGVDEFIEFICVADEHIVEAFKECGRMAACA